MADAQTQAAAIALLDLCKAKKLTIATAESCTGGLVAGALTEIAGSSAVVDRGFVTYTNEAKQQMLGVPADDAASRTARSAAQTAEAMANGALAHSPADLAVSITGIAGPGGGTAGEAGRPRAFRRRHARRQPDPSRAALRRHRPRRGAPALGAGGAGDAVRACEGRSGEAVEPCAPALCG